jgi:GDP-L-fucose synthase
MIAMNTVWGAAQAGVKRLLFLGSTCIYPRMAPQPIPEDALLSGPLEKTNEGYALAKIAGLRLCGFLRREKGLLYHSLMPTNLYGPGDNYDIEHGHVLPTLIRKFETAKGTVRLWGTGSAIREFLHVDDLASACLFALSLENPPDVMNVGSGEEVTIRELAEAVKRATGSSAQIEWNSSKPDGTPRKLCDTSLIRSLGWKPRISLEEGLAATVASYRAEVAAGTVRLGR